MGGATTNVLSLVVFMFQKIIVLLLLLEGTLGLPVVDKGVFVITGVKTCREGYGYCILGTDCTVDKEFIADDLNGHCDGLKKAFTPRAFFVCCQSLENSTFHSLPSSTTTSTTTTTLTPLSIEEDDEQEEPNDSNASVSSTSNEDSGSKASSTSVESSEVVVATGEPNSNNNTSAAAAAAVVVSSTASSTVVEEVQTQVSVSENFNVVVGELVGSSNNIGVGGSSNKEPVLSKPAVEAVAEDLQVVQQHPQCGFKATFYNGALGQQQQVQQTTNNHQNVLRIDGSRLAAQQTSLVCWTGAIVRSPSSLTLQDPGSFICTGALISEEFLLTTATCVSRLFAQDLSLFKVALGSRHLVHPMNGPTPDATYKDIVQLIVHEDYNIQGLFKRVNDIALVRLSKTSTVRTDEKSQSPYCTVCLPEGEEDHSGEDCIVTGFSHPTGSAASIDDIVASGGSIEAIGGGNGNVPSAHDTDGILHEAEQHIEYANICEVQLTNFTVAQNTLLRNDLNIEGSKLVCASGKFNAEACFSPRDAGSPLACSSSSRSRNTNNNNPDQFKLVGVFSSGFHCGTSSSPVLYTDVSKFVPWVKANMMMAQQKKGET